MAHIHELIDFTVTGFVVFHDRVLLILHKKLGLWLPPGGHIELDEDPEQALLREIKEECGLDIEIIGEKPEVMSDRTKFLFVPAYMDIHRISDSHRHIGLQYFCRAETDQVAMNDHELDAIKWFSLAEIEKSDILLPEVKFYAAQAIKKINLIS